MRTALGVCVLWSLWACAPSPETTTATLELHSLPSCELPHAVRTEIRAAGDFPMQRRQLSGSAQALDGFPPSTRWLGVQAQNGEERAGGLVALRGANLRQSVLMLPFGKSCPLGDPLAAASRDAALAPLPGGGLLIAGGSDEGGIPTARAAVLPPGGALVSEVAGGMLLRRAGATATLVGTRVVVAGGGPDGATFEVYDTLRAVFDPAQSSKLSRGPRRDHGAAGLRDGRVLIVGGRSALGGDPLASAELIDLVTGKATVVDGELQFARVAPQVLLQDNGDALVVLGTDANGQLVKEVERFDVAKQRFELFATLPSHGQAALAALAGDRLAYVGCDGPGTECETLLLLPDGTLLAPAVDYDTPWVSELRDLEQLQLLPLRDGRVLLSGRDPTAAIARRGFVLDLSVPTSEPTELSRVPEHLLMLEDGTRVELDASGASLGRDEVQSDLDAPSSPLVGSGVLHMALDAPQRWALRADGLHALQQARIDLPHLRFADARIEIDLEGTGVLLLGPDGLPAIEVQLGTKAISLDACSLARSTGVVAVERHGRELTLHSGNSSLRCSAPKLDDHIRVGLRVEAGARIATLSLARL